MQLFILSHGCYSLLVQIVLLREISLLFLGHEISLGLALTAWLFWVGMGSSSRIRFLSRLPLEWFSPLVTLSVFLTVLIVRLAKGWVSFGTTPGVFAILAVSIGFTCLPCFGMGRIFAMSCRITEGKPPAMMYVFESLGAILAAVLYTFFFSGRLSHLATISWAGTIFTGVSLWTSRSIVIQKKPADYRLFLKALSALIPLILYPRLDRLTRNAQWSGYELLFSQDAPYSHLAVAKMGSLNALFENGFASVIFPDASAQEELVHWALLAHPSPRRVLVLGSGGGARLGEILKHPAEEVVWVEPDRWLIAALRRFLPANEETAFSHAKVRLETKDARAWLRQNSNPFDVVIQTVGEPMNAQLNRFFTREFFEEVRNALRPGGVMAFSIPSAENYLSPQTIFFSASILSTLRAVFPEIQYIPGDRLTVLARMETSPGTVSVEAMSRTWARRYDKRKVRNQVILPSNFPFLLHPGRIARVQEALNRVRGVAINSDFHPVSYFSMWRVWFSKYVSPGYFVGFAAILVVCGWSLAKLWQQRKAFLDSPVSLAVFFLGFWAMTVETVILFMYQSFAGIVFWKMGILFGSFMAGSAMGAWIGQSVADGPPGRLLKGFAAALLISLIGTVVLCKNLALVAELAETRLLWTCSALLGGSGFVVGLAFALSAAFPVKAVLARANPGELYAFDLWGSAGGGFLATAVLVPLFGFPTTLSVSAGALAAAILALVRRAPSDLHP